MKFGIYGGYVNRGKGGGRQQGILKSLCLLQLAWFPGPGLMRSGGRSYAPKAEGAAPLPRKKTLTPKVGLPKLRSYWGQASKAF